MGKAGSGATTVPNLAAWPMGTQARPVSGWGLQTCEGTRMPAGRRWAYIEGKSLCALEGHPVSLGRQCLLPREP